MSAEPEQDDSTRASARAALRARGIPFDEQRALEHIRKGDGETVTLFLEAGLSPTLTDADGVHAIVIAARRAHKEVCRLLIQYGAPAELLVDALRVPTLRKDKWERLAAMSGVLTFVSTLVVAGVGWHFTNRYNERQQENAARQAERDADIRRQQARVSEMDTVVKMIPHLTQGEQSKKAALLALSALATPALAVEMAQLFGGLGSVQALESIVAQSSAGGRSNAVSALAGIASQRSGAGAAAANAANVALEGIFEGKEKSLVTLLHRGEFFCNGFVAGSPAPIVIAPTYCAGGQKVGELTVKFWDGRVASVSTISIHGPIASFVVSDLGNTVPLLLADAVPQPGSRLLKIAYGVNIDRMAQDSGRVSVVSGIVEGTSTVPAPETGARQQSIQVLKVRLSQPPSAAPSGEGGGPILDATGAVACMVYLGGAERGLELCLPSTAIRQALSAKPSRTS